MKPRVLILGAGFAGLEAAKRLAGKPGFEHLRDNTFELCEYLVDVAHVTKVDGEFARKVGLHMSCHGLRELRDQGR